MYNFSVAAGAHAWLGSVFGSTHSSADLKETILRQYVEKAHFKSKNTEIHQCALNRRGGTVGFSDISYIPSEPSDFFSRLRSNLGSGGDFFSIFIGLIHLFIFL